MIVELNRVYVTTAPDAAAGMHGPDDFSTMDVSNLTYSHLKKLNNTEAAEGKKVKCYGQIFDLKGKPMQAFVFSELPEKMIKKRITDRIKIVKENTK